MSTTRAASSPASRISAAASPSTISAPATPRIRSLRKLGVDIVKIDGAFVQNIVKSEDDRAFVRTMIDLARRLKLKTVAEWVQDEEAAKLLADWGCDYLQGALTGLATIERPWAPAPAQAASA